MAEARVQQANWQSWLTNSDLHFAAGLIALILMMFLPLPPIILDLLLSASITLGFLVLLVAIYVKEPLEFSTFPTFLLLTTLFRLALNIATTRNILLEGGSSDVSQVITAFGEFVVGGNYFVGFVIFLILVTVNFVVITKGAGRVAEVGARFTLDAMPGKQMSIDADLNAGIIDRNEAKRRRKKIETEADFYGAMDGASKFVRGDAIAAIIITAINIVVGLGLGVFQQGMSFANAAEVYTLLTVGDGLVSQIPSIIISVAAGIVVTRASTNTGLSSALKEQIFLRPKSLAFCGTLLLCMAVLPGLPTFSLLLLALVFFGSARAADRTLTQRAELSKTQKAAEKNKGPGKDSVEALLHVDALILEVGVGLIPLVDADQSGEILERIVSARKQFASDLGIVVPMVLVRDNVQIKPGDYQILLKGVVIASGSLMPDNELAMAPDDSVEPIEGIRTTEPAYGLEAYWIKTSQREDAAFKGYTVVNCATVIVTHLTKVIGEHSPDLIGRQEVQSLVDSLKSRSPKVVEEVISSDGLTLGQVVKVLQNLLREGVTVRDLLTIFENLADHCRTIKHPDILTRYVRKALGRHIVGKYTGPAGDLSVVTLDRGVEDLVQSSIHYEDDGTSSLSLAPDVAQAILSAITSSVQRFEKIGSLPVLLCSAQIRWDLKKLLGHFLPELVVIAYDEVPKETEVNNLDVIQVSL